MPRISEDTIQRVAAASDVVDVIGSYLQLKRAGANWKGLCPFHNEKTPSLHVNPARQTFKCFGCGEGGSVFRFITQYENVDFPTAVRRLAGRAGIPIAEESEGDQAVRGEKDRLLAIHRDATTWFHENLMRQKFAAAAREYLKGRGFSSEVAARWRLGFAPESWDALFGALRTKKYSNEEIIRSGLVIVKDEAGARPYDRFRNRVMFPICNDFGDVIGFSGRTLGDDPAKYVNSPETPIFTKGRVLFGLEKSKRAIIDANEAVVCEGQLDMIAAFEAGVQNVTAPQGTAFTPQQARLLRRFGESIVLCFDSDAAGRKAVERSLPALLAVGLSVRVARVPAGEDPDSLVRKHGAEALRGVIAKARDYFDDVIDEEIEPGVAPQKRAAVAQRLAAHVREVSDPALAQALIQRVHAKLEISREAFSELMKAAVRPTGEPDETDEQERVEIPHRARLIYSLALHNDEAAEWLRAQSLRMTDLGGEFELLDRFLTSKARPENEASMEEFRTELSREARLALQLPPPQKSEETFSRRAEKEVLALNVQKLNDASRGILLRLANPGTDESTHVGFQNQLLEIRKQILDLQKRLGQV